MARVLIIGGGARGRGLARALVESGQVVRVSTRAPARREAIEAVGAECWVGDPERLATLTGALERVAIVCWLLARVERERALALHGPRLESFLGEIVDTGVRGFVYEASPGALPPELLQGGLRSLGRIARENAIRWAAIEAPLGDEHGWRESALAAVEGLLEEPPPTLS